MQKHLPAFWMPLVAAFFLFALPASATVIYMYEGYNYTNIRDNDPPTDSYDTSMNITGEFTLNSPLPDTMPSLTDIRGCPGFGASFDDRRHTLTTGDPNVSIGAFEIATQDGEIIAWKKTLYGDGDPYDVDITTTEYIDRARLGYTPTGGDEGYIQNTPGNWTFVPEPSTAVLLVMGLAGFAATGRRRSLH